METYKDVFTRVFTTTLRQTGIDALKKTSMFGNSMDLSVHNARNSDNSST